MCSRRLSRIIRMLSAPLAVAFLVILYRESQYNKIYGQQDWEFAFSPNSMEKLIDDGLDAQFLNPSNLQNGVQFPDTASNFEPKFEVPPNIIPQIPQQPAVPVAPAAVPVQPVAPVPLQPVTVQPADPIVNQQPVPVNPEPANNVAPAEPAAPEKPKTPKPYVKKVMGEVIDHAMMISDEPENVVVQRPVATLPPLPPIKAAMTENKEYRSDVTWPPLSELQVSDTFKQENEQFYKQGMNRQRQKAHGSEVPAKRNPDLIITGAKKCGTTALKIFMNYHNSFQDTPGERHFFNRPSNWQKGYEW